MDGKPRYGVGLCLRVRLLVLVACGGPPRVLRACALIIICVVA